MSADPSAYALLLDVQGTEQANYPLYQRRRAANNSAPPAGSARSNGLRSVM
ncbi:hypothetical protein [Crystallibacter crystallopoietes]|uniref:hypothetical protein n=1 Tax=Crystallibacter crystallopoietes TaxID=37928 RepID=UPI00167F84EE|nr:hypothetical protein [Arthrobacter crystallopoietes]